MVPNPFETPRPRGTRLFQGTLRVIVALQCWGLAAARLHQGEAVHVSQLLEQAYGFSGEETERVLDMAAYVAIVAGLTTLFRPAWFVLLPVLIWQLLISICMPMYGDRGDDLLAAIQYAPRYTAPLALLLIDFWPPSLKTSLVLTRSAVGLLRVATAAVFIGHGCALLQMEGEPVELRRFAAYVARRGFNVTLSDAQIHTHVFCIAVCEIVAAACLLTSRNRTAAAVLSAWGFISSALFALVLRGRGYHETLLRAGTWGAPLVVLLFWVYAIQETTHHYLPEDELPSDDAVVN